MYAFPESFDRSVLPGPLSSTATPASSWRSEDLTYELGIWANTNAEIIEGEVGNRSGNIDGYSIRMAEASSDDSEDAASGLSRVYGSTHDEQNRGEEDEESGDGEDEEDQEDGEDEDANDDGEDKDEDWNDEAYEEEEAQRRRRDMGRWAGSTWERLRWTVEEQRRAEEQRRVKEERWRREDTRQRWLSSEWPETTGQYATAADLPPELFEIIIRNAVGVGGGRYDPNYKAVTILCRCTLVARSWAKFARPILWGEVLKKQTANESSHARMLIETKLRGCPRLTPVIDLLTGIHAKLTFHEERSWLHTFLTAIPDIRSKLTEVTLIGFGPSTSIPLTTPHWGTPFSTAGLPPLAHLASLDLSHLHFDQFSDLLRLLRHFSCPKDINMSDLTWDKTDIPLHWPPQSIHSKHSTGTMCIYANRCTDNTLAAIAAHALDARLPLRKLPPHEQLQVQQLYQALPQSVGEMLNARVIPASFPSQRFGDLLVTCSHPGPHTTAQVLGVLLVLKDSDESRIDTLRNFLKLVINFPGLRAIGVAYHGETREDPFSLAEAVASISHVRPDVMWRVLYSRDRRSFVKSWIERDHRTNEPTGQVWECDKEKDEEHSYCSSDCSDTLWAMAMSSAVEEHMRKNGSTPYPETQTVV
ncbi:hypothetical protein BDW22DRAFT_1361950 [Trametopsis cervina]|nr:hypothetical protein BDW22DRAFT_1361950 [Trametopsis cervina]